LRAQNFATVAGLAPHHAPKLDATRLACSHIYLDGTVTSLS
jgi:hypothetical protein